MGTPHEPGILEAEIAAALAETWDAYWDSGPTVIGTATPESPLLAERAISIYAFTDPVLQRASSGSPTPSEPAIVATGLLRELADGYALASFGWTTSVLRTLGVDRRDNGIPLPDRNDLERLIAAQGVSEWCESFGYSIALREADPLRESGPGRDVVRDDTGAAGLVSDWCLSLNGYCRAEASRLTPRGRSIVLNVQGSLRDAAAPNLVLARRWVRWARARMGAEAQAVCVVWQLAAEAMFEIAHARSEEALAQLRIPSPELLAVLLEDGAIEWLELHGASIPECLTNGAGR